MAMDNMIGKSIKFEDWKGDTRMGTIVSILENGDYEVSTDRGMALVKKAEIVKMRRGGGVPKATQMKREKVAKVMHEFKEGKLRSGSKRGPVVKDRDQAIAIALSEAGMSKKMGSGGKNDFSIVVIKPLNTRVGSKVLNWFKKNNVKINFDGEHDWHTKGYGEEIWLEDEKNIKNSHFIYIFELKDFSNRKELEKGLDELENQNEGKIQISYLDEVPDWIYESYEDDNMAQGGGVDSIEPSFVIEVNEINNWQNNWIEHYAKDINEARKMRDEAQERLGSQYAVGLRKIKPNEFATGGSLNTITPVSGGNYVDKIMVSNNRQLEMLKDFDDVTFENTIVYELPSKRVLYNGRFEKRALDVLYDDKMAQGGGLSSFNPKSFTLDELKDYLWKNEIWISYFKKGQTGITSASESKIIWDGSSHSLALKQWRDKKLTISDYGQLEVDKGDENLYMTLVVYELDGSDNPYEIRIYSKDNHAELRKFANYLIEKFAKGGGIPEYVPVSQKQNKAEVDRFVEYVNMFYGKGEDAMGKDGYTKAQIKTAITKYLKDLDKEYTWGYGDSLDRERVYSYLMNPEQEGINNPSFAKGGMIKAGDMVRSTKFKGYEGVVVSKGKSKEMGKNYYFVRLNETLPNGDYQHDIMWADEVEKMATGGGVEKKELGGFLLGAAVGVIGTKLTESKPKEKIVASVSKQKKSTWRENVAAIIDKEGFDYAFDGYTDFKDEVKDREFHQLRKAYLNDYNSFKDYIESDANSKKFEEVIDSIDKEGFDYTFNGYSDWKNIKDLKFHSLLKKYKASRNKIVDYIEYNDSKKMAKGGGVGKFKKGDSITGYFNYNYTYNTYEPSFYGASIEVDGEVIEDDGEWVKIKWESPIDEVDTINKRVVQAMWSYAKGGHTGWKHKMATGGGVSKNAEYVSKRNIDKVTYNKGKDVKTVTGKDLLDGVYVSKKATTKPGKMYVELKSVGNVDFDDSSERGKNIALKKVNVTSIDEAKKVVRAFIDENDLGGGNWVGGKVFENGKNIGYIAYNGNYFEGERKMAQGGSTGKDKYTVSIDWELSKPRIKYGRKFFKDIFANSNKEAESIAVEQWNSVKANSNKKVLSINSINMTQLRKKPILDKPERKMTTGGDVTPIFESGVMISKPYYFFEKGFFTTEEYRIDNKFYNNVRASFVIANGIATKDQALKKANAFYEFVKSAQSKEQYDDLSEQFIIKNRKMAKGGSMGWKHKMAKGAKLKLEQQYHPSKYLTKEQWEKWNEYVKTGKIDGKKENNMFAVARWVGASVSNINGYEIEQRATKLK